MTPRDYQQPEIDKIVAAISRHGVAANASVTGSGKTVIALLAAKALNRAVCVVAPKVTLTSWEKTAKACGVKLHWAKNYEILRSKSTNVDKDFMIAPLRVTPRHTRWYIPRGSLLIFDEAHKLSGLDSANSAMLVAAKKQNIPTLLLSATLAESPLKLKAIGFAMGLHDNSEAGFYRFCMRNGVKKTPFGLSFDKDPTVMADVRKKCGSRLSGLTIDQIPDMPRHTIQVLGVIPDIDVDDVYARVLEEQELNSFDPLVESLRARQLAELGKVNGLADQVRVAYEAGNAPVVFVNFLETGERLLESLADLDPFFIYGEVKNDIREEVIGEFNTGKRHLLICQSASMGVGVSLHRTHEDARPRISFISPGWSSTEFIQILGRIRRLNSLDSHVVQKVIFAEGSEIEERVAKSIEAKLDCLSELNDSDLHVALTE